MALFTKLCLRNFCLLKSVNGVKLNISSSYKSAIALENIYPNSKLTLTTPAKAPESSEKFDGYIPLKDLVITYSRSSGPGGQNVNTVNTKVDLRLHLQSASWLHADIRSKLAETQKNKINADGFLVIKSDLTRQQHLNLADCLSKLRKLIWSATAAEPPPPSGESLEKIRRMREKAARNRLLEKRNRSAIKEGRQAPSLD
ncbi:large ribosomal subunit protein mL62 [Neocloeon triangulifer]|uniref:large ribosomal subunit protein mL62 n=1 Tax=Neocloeon triangulifer TaxID=2078957 RepID=UPI00286F5172|nr:large ribosomal subunit protein mL62 [Neocloeon triangulifer]